LMMWYFARVCVCVCGEKSSPRNVDRPLCSISRTLF
jgi:hypothetical protein